MMMVSARLVLLILLFVTKGLLVKTQTTVQLNGNDVCTATISHTQVQKVPITGIQTKIVRYVTRCGFGLLKCSRYRTIYVKAYREITATAYRSKNVCCAGFEAVRGRCVHRVTTTPDPSRRNGKWSPKTTVGVPERAGYDPRFPAGDRTHSRYPAGGGAWNGIDGNAGRQGTHGTGNAPLMPPHEGTGHSDHMTPLEYPNRGVAGEGLDYDKSPEVRDTPHGPGTLSVTLGVGVFMSLTGMLAGILLMKIRTRNGKELDAIPLTRRANSRRTTKKKGSTLSGRFNKNKQRVVSYVDIMDIREKMPAALAFTEAKKRIIPQVSLPRIPEAASESITSAELVDERNDQLLELKELKQVPSPSPPYAVVKKSKKGAHYADPDARKSEGFEEHSGKFGYAKVDEICDNDDNRSKFVIVEGGKSESAPGCDTGTAVKDLYATINRNVNQCHSEHRYSRESMCSSDPDNTRSEEQLTLSTQSDMEQDDGEVYGPRMEQPLSRSDDAIAAKEDAFKYDRLRRNPRARSTGRSKRYSELYESI